MRTMNYNQYSKSITNFFRFLKNSKDHKELYLKSIKIKNYDNLLLIPVSNIHLNDTVIINKLCKWRNKNLKFFLNKKKTNFEKNKLVNVKAIIFKYFILPPIKNIK